MCDLCRNANAALGRKVTPRGGAWANVIAVPQSLVHVLPDDVPLQIAAITEPLSCAVRIIDRANIRPGIHVCVIGAGPIGLFSAVLAKHAGANVIVSETRPSRREAVRRMGIDLVIDPAVDDLYESVMQFTHGRGVEASIEAVGFGPTLSQAITVVAAGGTVVWAGVAPTDVRVPISPNDMFMKEYSLRTSWGGILEYERTIRLEQIIDWTPLVQEVYPLEQVMDAVMFARTEASGKVLLQM
jgi:threonine dehydrogenase-like Zn-dependent dehydrogenase